MVKRNLFRYSSVLMCVVLTAASLVGCGSKTAATTGTDTAYVTEMAAGSTEATITQAITNELAVSNKSTLATNTRQETVYVFNDASGNRITSLSTKRLQTLTAMRLLIRLSQVKMRQ